jgi:hypothetical protein
MSFYTSISLDRLVGLIGIPGAPTRVDVGIDGRFAPVPHLTWGATADQSGAISRHSGNQPGSHGGPALSNVPAKGGLIIAGGG